MNAVVLVAGYEKGGNQGARDALREFWSATSRAASMSPLRRTLWSRLTGSWSLNSSPGYLMMDLVSRMASPYDFNPLDLNPLQDFLDEQVDFELVRACSAVRLFIPATSVRTGRVRTFTNAQLSPAAVMASACLPQLYKAVEIDGEAYWDGGYSGNPALHPLIYNTDTRDILIVQINPTERPDVPRRARDILDRVNEITFNASLLAELRAIRFVARQLAAGHLDNARYKHMHIHRIDGAAALRGLDASSKLNTEWAFLKLLHDRGYQAAKHWLDDNFEQIGKNSTLDLDALLG